MTAKLLCLRVARATGIGLLDSGLVVPNTARVETLRLFVQGELPDDAIRTIADETGLAPSRLYRENEGAAVYSVSLLEAQGRFVPLDARIRAADHLLERWGLRALPLPLPPIGGRS